MRVCACVCIPMHTYIYLYVYSISSHYFVFTIMQNLHFAPSAVFMLFKTLTLFWSCFMFVFKDFL